MTHAEHPVDPDQTRYPAVGRSFGLVGLLLVATGLAEILAFLLLPRGTTASTRLLATLVVVWPVVLLTTKHLHGGSLEATFSVRKVPLPWIGLAGLAGLSMTLLILGLVTFIPGPAPESAVDLHEAAAVSNRFSLLLAMLVAGPVCEELFFRGWMLQAWANRFGALPAVVATAALFSVLHILSWRALLAFPLGLLFGWICIKAKSVIPAIAAHSVGNSASSLIDPILSLTGSSPEQIAAMESVPLWLPAIALVGVVVSVGLLHERCAAQGQL